MVLPAMEALTVGAVVSEVFGNHSKLLPQAESIAAMAIKVRIFVFSMSFTLLNLTFLITC